MTKYPFEATDEDVLVNTDAYVESVFACLESEFQVMPKGLGFVEYGQFEQGYEALKRATNGFADLRTSSLVEAVGRTPIALVVLRTMLGFTPPEWAYVTIQRTHVAVPQGFVRSLDRKIRMAPEGPLRITPLMAERLTAMVETACELLAAGAPATGDDELHRLDKADTKTGIVGIRQVATIGVPYAMLLYERFLGRPFAGHRDSVSELIGGGLEAVIEDVLTDAGISFRKTRRAERIEGLDQAPDFVVPSEFSPQVLIEAKITEDDGTARDKVTRIQHLGELSEMARRQTGTSFEVIACIGGRGFGVRREDMKKMILATHGKVFTYQTLDRMIECTTLRDYRTVG